MVDITSLLTLQARSRRNARKATHRLRQSRRAAADVQRAVDEANRARSGSEDMPVASSRAERS